MGRYMHSKLLTYALNMYLFAFQLFSFHGVTDTVEVSREVATVVYYYTFNQNIQVGKLIFILGI